MVPTIGIPAERVIVDVALSHATTRRQTRGPPDNTLFLLENLALIRATPLTERGVLSSLPASA